MSLIILPSKVILLQPPITAADLIELGHALGIDDSVANDDRVEFSYWQEGRLTTQSGTINIHITRTLTWHANRPDNANIGGST